MEVFCLLIESAFALLEVVGGFLVALPWIKNKWLKQHNTVYKWHPPTHIFMISDVTLCFCVLQSKISHYLLHCARGIFILWTGFASSLFLCRCWLETRLIKPLSLHAAMQMPLNEKYPQAFLCQHNIKIVSFYLWKLLKRNRKMSVNILFLTDFRRTAWSSATTLSTIAASSSLC